MQEIATDRAGVIRFTPDEVLSFPSGLPGFTEHQKFILSQSMPLDPLAYLQSLMIPYPRFLLIPAALVDPDYRLEIKSWDSDILFCNGTAAHRADLSVYFVVSVAVDAPPTVNMLAPIAIRDAKRRGVQAVRSDCLYSHAAPLALGHSGLL